jgi:hypothetical protein
MGMYTEIYVNVDLKRETPDNVLQVLKAMCGQLDREQEEEALREFPDRWCMLFSDCSYYTPRTYCKYLQFDEISKQWSLLGKGDIKNYGQEIQKFFEWVMPWVDAFEGEFIGYSRYEESDKPTLYFKTEDKVG